MGGLTAQPGSSLAMRNMRLTVSFQTHGRRARELLRISPSRPVARLARPILFFLLGPTFIAVAIYFFCIAPFFFISRRSFHSPLLRPFVFHGAGSLGLSPSPRRFFPTACSLSLSFFLAPQRKPSSSLVFVFEAYNRVGAVFDLESTLVRGSCRFSFPFYLISSLRN